MSSVQNRIALEKKIARKTVTLALSKGFTISVNDGEETVLHRSSSVRDILNAMFSTDEDYLMVYSSIVGIPRLGWIRFIYGNDGYDVINDYSTTLEDKFMSEVNDYCEKLEGN